MNRTDTGETGDQQTAIVTNAVRMGQPGGRRRIAERPALVWVVLDGF